jgi:hypothetical protein
MAGSTATKQARELPEVRRETIRLSSVADYPAVKDELGFEPYVRAVARFLSSPDTHPPLCVSIEGEWGSGKSSFLRQLQHVLETAPQQNAVKPVVVRFNAWRHDKEESLWAAFALKCLTALRNRLTYPQQLTASWKLRTARSGRLIVACYLMRILLLPTFLLLPLIASISFCIQGLWDPTIRAIWSQLTAQVLHGYRDLVPILSAALATPFFVQLSRANRFIEQRLQKLVAEPRYKGRVAFIEEFHEDFPRILDSYTRPDERVFVFIDDLDRCDVPKGAELMQAINLLIDDNAKVIFVIGMDREKVAAGIAAKYSAVLPYFVKSDQEPSLHTQVYDNPIDFGHSFVEKFVQLQVYVPRPKDLSCWSLNVVAKDTRPSVSGGAMPFRVTSSESAASDSSGQADTPVEFAPRKRFELCLGPESELTGRLINMVAGVFGSNPRRVKHFLNVYRLYALLAYELGLLDCGMTPEQIAKFVAIILRWPEAVGRLQANPSFLATLCRIAAKEEYAEDRLANKQGLISLLLYTPDSPSGGTYAMEMFDATGLIDVAARRYTAEAEATAAQGTKTVEATALYPAQLISADAVADFTIASDSSGDWSYGWSRSPVAAPFTCHSELKEDFFPGIDWRGSSQVASDLGIMHNRTGMVAPGIPPTYTIPHDMLHMHPGAGGEYDVVRWTCPRSGRYAIRGRFAGLDTQTHIADSDVDVVVNSSVSLFKVRMPTVTPVLSGIGSELPFTFDNIRLTSGDTVDFVVGVGPSRSHGADSTGLQAKINEEGG